MKEDINFRIIKKLDGRRYEKNVSSFLKDAIREEFERTEQKRWKFRETYDRLIEKYADQEDSEK
ncbi:MAG: hypothetical protein ACYS30_08245 [Planctomycetota bacterium]|jgi:hypothetical protein